MNNIDKITQNIGRNFRSFGGGRDGGGFNIVADALKNQPLQFAACVDIKDVVTAVLDQSGFDDLLLLREAVRDLPNKQDSLFDPMCMQIREMAKEK